MSNLQHLLRAAQVETFEEARALMARAPYHVNVRYLDNLCRFHLTEESDTTNEVVQECTGIIMEMPYWQIVCYGMDLFTEDEPEISVHNVMSEAVDGSLIRLYYYTPAIEGAEGSWRIATTKSIDAGDAYWGSPKSFKTLFLEAAVKLNFSWDSLDKDNTYSFVLQHPDSRNVTPVTDHHIYHVATRSMKTLKEVNVFLPNVERPRRLTGLPSEMSWKFHGVVVQTPMFKRCKIKNPLWQRVAELKGNYPNVARRWLDIRNDSATLTEFLRYFPEYTMAFDQLSSMLLNLPDALWSQFKYYMIDQNARMSNQDPMYFGVMALYVRFKKSEGTEPTTLEVVRDYVSHCDNDDLAKILGLN